MTREVGFYGLSIVLLYLALHDRRPSDDDELGDDHIYISFLDAVILFAGYVAYVAVCANMDSIVAFCGGTSKANDEVSSATANEKQKFYGSVEPRSRRSSFDLPEMPFLREAFGDEPVSNFSDRNQENLLITPSGASLRTQESIGSLPESLRKFSDGKSLRNILFKVEQEKPSDEHDIHDIELNAVRVPYATGLHLLWSMKSTLVRG